MPRPSPVQEDERVRGDFEDWYASVATPASRECDPHDDSRRLASELRRLGRAERVRYADRLLEVLLGERRYGLTLFLLGELESEVGLAQLARTLLPLPGPLGPAEETHLAELVRLVACGPATRPFPAVTIYLIERPIAPVWPGVAWTLWPRRRTLFGSAWARFFTEIDPLDWDRRSVIEPFLAEPAAARAVREPLASRAAERWKRVGEEIRRAAGDARWLGETERRALDRALE